MQEKQCNSQSYCQDMYHLFTAERALRCLAFLAHALIDSRHIKSSQYVS